MKILHDHNLDRRLKNHLTYHEVATTFECGWANIQNGELLSLAEENGFGVFITSDANIKNQQNLKGRSISIVVLRAYNNRLTTHIEMLEELLNSLDDLKPGSIQEVFHPNMKF